MSTLAKYGVVILGVAAYILYARPDLRKKALALLQQTPAPTAYIPADPKNAAKTKMKPKPKPAKSKGKEPQLEVPAPDHTTPEAIREEEEDDATEFAKRMHKAQTGESLQKKATASDKPAKKRSKNKKNKGEQSNGHSTPSDNGASSSAPAAKAAEVVSSVSETLSGAAGMATDIGKKVVDTLHINQPEVPAPVTLEDGFVLPKHHRNKNNKDKSAQQEETKKQRQREAKRQAEKELNAETERLRKRKLEEQLRTARIARGEAARNGESLQAAPIPKRSAWGKSNSQEQSSAMLDTLDVSNASSATPSETRSTPVIIASDDGFEEVNGTEARMLNGSD